MSDITTKFFNGINNTPALGIALAAWKDIYDSGFGLEVVMLNWDNQAIVAFIKDKPVGVIIYENQKYLKTVTILMGWVHSDFRNKGVYKSMWFATVDKARELEAVKIDGGTHLKNTAMRATAKALGRVETSVNFEYIIPLLEVIKDDKQIDT